MQVQVAIQGIPAPQGKRPFVGGMEPASVGAVAGDARSRQSGRATL